jgi:tetratricopeptide (TPR) repeat protein
VKRTPRRDTVQLLVEALGLSGEARTAFVTAAREPATRRTPKQAGQLEGGVEDAPIYTHRFVPPATIQTPAPAGGFLGAVPEGSLIGRETEFSRVLVAIEAVMQGSGRLLVVAGEPGVGKTRISQEATLACRDQGFVVATGRCYEPHLSVPYYPFLEALFSLYGAAPDSVRWQIPTRWPHVLRLLPDQPSDALPATGASPQEEQQRLFWAVTGFLQSISESAPVVLLLDDLHWADVASRLGPMEPSMSLVSLYSSLSINLIVAGRYDGALEAIQSATEIARALDDERTLAWVETMRGAVLGLMGRLGEGRRMLEERLSLAEAANDYWGQLSAAHYLGKVTAPQGDFDAALHCHGRALELAQRLGARSRISAETSNLSEVLFYLVHDQETFWAIGRVAL